MRAPRSARLPKLKPKTRKIEPANSRYERGTRRGQVRLNVSIARYQMDELSDIAVLSTTVVATDLAGNRVISLNLESKKAASELRDFLTDMPPLSNRNNVFLDSDTVY